MKPEILKIKEFPDLVKDTRSGAIISDDATAYYNYIRNRCKIHSDAEKIDELELKLESIASEMATIKQMVSEFFLHQK